MKGEISGGKTQILNDALNSNNYTECKTLVLQRVREAKENKFHTLFYLINFSY
jgi:hypothetical protein